MGINPLSSSDTAAPSMEVDRIVPRGPWNSPSRRGPSSPLLPRRVAIPDSAQKPLWTTSYTCHISPVSPLNSFSSRGTRSLSLPPWSRWQPVAVLWCSHGVCAVRAILSRSQNRRFSRRSKERAHGVVESEIQLGIPMWILC